MGCTSIERLAHNSPFTSTTSDEAGKDRVNLWPLVYQNGDRLAVHWPLYDRDNKGFALRPLIARDESRWEVLLPLALPSFRDPVDRRHDPPI